MANVSRGFEGRFEAAWLCDRVSRFRGETLCDAGVDMVLGGGI